MALPLLGVAKIGTVKSALFGTTARAGFTGFGLGQLTEINVPFAGTVSRTTDTARLAMLAGVAIAIAWVISEVIDDD